MCQQMEERSGCLDRGVEECQEWKGAERREKEEGVRGGWEGTGHGRRKRKWEDR